jgi:hypothetical protein
LQFDLLISISFVLGDISDRLVQVYDEDNLQQDKRLGVAKLAVNNIQPETPTEITLKLMQSLDSLKIKDYRDRGSLHLKVRVGFLSLTSTKIAFKLKKYLVDINAYRIGDWC